MHLFDYLEFYSLTVDWIEIEIEFTNKLQLIPLLYYVLQYLYVLLKLVVSM
jgi:hypothetical protein